MDDVGLVTVVTVLVAAAPVAAVVCGVMAWAICAASDGTLAFSALETLLSIVSSVEFTVLVITALSRLACATIVDVFASVDVLVVGTVAVMVDEAVVIF